MAYEGMDPDEVDALARRISSEAGTLQSILSRLDGITSNLRANWDGADSVRFHDTYQSEYRGQIANAIEHLNQLSSVAVNNANQQRATSA